MQYKIVLNTIYRQCKCTIIQYIIKIIYNNKKKCITVLHFYLLAPPSSLFNDP